MKNHLVSLLIAAGALALLLDRAGAVDQRPGSAQLKNVPTEIPFQGFLTDDLGNPLDQTVLMQVRLYDALTGGNQVWGPEQHSAEVNDGVFQISLGRTVSLDPTDFRDNQALFLAINVSGEDLSPRTRLLTSPFAMQTRFALAADDADLLDGFDSSEFSQTSHMHPPGDGDTAGIANSRQTSFTTNFTVGETRSVNSITIDCPASGFVSVSSVGWFNISHVAGSHSEVWFDVRTEDANLSIIRQAAVTRIPSSAPSGLWINPLTSTNVFPVSAGANTFYLNVIYVSGAGDLDVGQNNLVATFYPTAYGTVSKTSASSGGNAEGPL